MNRLFWDIETSPNEGLFWRTGYRISLPPENITKERAIVAIGYKWQHEDDAHVLTWNRGDDGPMIRKFVKIMAKADELVAHNGDKFDTRWLHTRALIHGIIVPPIKTVDTLAMARRNFYFNSNKLDYIAQLLLGKRKNRTDFELWKRVVANDRDALQQMAEYCEVDVLILEEVYHELAKYHPPKSHVGVMQGKAKHTCPRCGTDSGTRSKRRVTARGTVQHQMRCTLCGGYYTISDRAYKDWLDAHA